MSSTEDEFNKSEDTTAAATSAKKRKIQRACDICRRKKSDGGQMQDNRCSNCIAYNFDCTYVEAAKKRGPPKGYVENLENRIAKLEKLLSRLYPDVNFTRDLDSFLDNEQWSNELVKRANSSASRPSLPSSPCSPTDIRVSDNVDSDDFPPSEDEFKQQTLAESLKKMQLNPKHHRFFGKSSGVNLVQTAIDLKNEVTGREDGLVAAVGRNHRAEYWAVRPWEIPPEDERPTYVFPQDDLLTSLVHLYFAQVNLIIPLLHRPTFEKSVAEGLHMRDDLFAATLLLVCAVASRYSNDPRIFLDGSNSTHSCGWRWFRQVQVVRKSLLAPPSLYDLQFYCLSVLFMQGSSAPQACWTMVGIGIRLAQDVGAHRKKVYNRKVTVEDELWKRAFWVLVSIDRSLSAALGRPCAIHDEDFDLDMPVECDDEYWEHNDPDQAFKQPPEMPSVIAYFNSSLKLSQILAFALRTIYSINKSKILLGFVGPQWEQHIVSELDSALNKWIDSVPDHLRWDPQREDMLFFNQSALLHAYYYHIQILIHRPFIPSPRKPSPLSFPSLAICANAARSCSRVIDIQRHRSGTAFPHILVPAFTSCVVLLLNIWGGKRSGLSSNPVKEMADVHKCLEAIRICEERWHPAGRLIDILVELACVGDLPLPGSTNTQKRERESDAPVGSATTTTTTTSSPGQDTPRSIAGMRRVAPHDTHVASAPPIQPPPPPPPPPQAQAQAQAQAQQRTQHMDPQTYALPMYSDELGRLPVHGHQLGYGGAAVAAAAAVGDLDGWYSQEGQQGQQGQQGQAGGLPQGSPTRLTQGPVAMGAAGVGVYPMEQLFFEHVASSFANPFAEGGYTPPAQVYDQTVRGEEVPVWSGVQGRFE